MDCGLNPRHGVFMRAASCKCQVFSGEEVDCELNPRHGVFMSIASCSKCQ